MFSSYIFFKKLQNYLVNDNYNKHLRHVKEHITDTGVYYKMLL